MEHPIRVLHVDDDPAFLDLAAELLERADGSLSVHSESDPAAVPSHIESEPIDCVVSDFDMPDVDGLELCRRVRREYPEFPFVLFTNRVGADIVEEAFEAGATDYIRKETGTHHFTLLANRVTLAVTRYRALCRLGTIDGPPGGRGTPGTAVGADDVSAADLEAGCNPDD